jgi:hypothetical protein
MTAPSRTRKCPDRVRARLEMHASLDACSTSGRAARQRPRPDTGGIDSHAGTTYRGGIEPTHELRIVPTERYRRDAQLAALRALLLPD